jgi:hypothetical protein
VWLDLLELQEPQEDPWRSDEEAQALIDAIKDPDS